MEMDWNVFIPWLLGGIAMLPAQKLIDFIKGLAPNFVQGRVTLALKYVLAVVVGAAAVLLTKEIDWSTGDVMDYVGAIFAALWAATEAYQADKSSP